MLLQLFSQKNELAETCEVFVLSTASLCVHTFAPHFFLPLNVAGNLFYPALRCGKGFVWTQPTPTFFFSLSSFYPSGAGIFILLVVHFSRFPGSASVLLFTVWCECVMISFDWLLRCSNCDSVRNCSVLCDQRLLLSKFYMVWCVFGSRIKSHFMDFFFLYGAVLPDIHGKMCVTGFSWALNKCDFFLFCLKVVLADLFPIKLVLQVMAPSNSSN